MKAKETTQALTGMQGEPRRLAEEQLRARRAGAALSAAGAEEERLRHELQVHEIELEMQNEALRATVEELELSRAKYFEHYDLAPVGFLTVDEKGVVLEANLTAAKLLGVNRGSLVQQPIASFMLKTELDFQALLPERHLEAGTCQDLEMRMQRADGSLFWAQLHCAEALGRSQSSLVYLLTLTVIDQRKQMEQTLHDSEEHFRTLCDAAPVGIFRSDREGNTSYCNPRWEEITGIPACSGMQADWISGIHPEDVEEFRRLWSEAMANAGSICHEHRRFLPDGKTAWTRVLASPVLGNDGTVLFHVGTLEDITELRQARHDMLKNQKLESLGVLAGGIAHDFNNVLTAIFGNISLARVQLNDPGLVAKRLEDAEQAIVRASDLTRQLLTFARGGEPILKVVKVNDLLRETVRFVLHGSNISCKFDLAEDMWPVEADQGQLARVIHNLVLNAAQAMPDGGTVTIVTEKIHTRDSGDRFLRISISDTGTGIADENLERIFDPYFTTKEEGNGLGLATCYSIIKKHGGKIRAESTVGAGSRFIISLPASEHAYVSEPEAEPARCRGIGRVLVMDDDDDIRGIAEGMLNELGYSVEMVENGSQAVELYRKCLEEGAPFSAAILDLTIRGGMGGRETIGELLKIDPAVKAVVSSGYCNDPVLANFQDYGFRSVLGKPYRLKELGIVLKKLLEP